MKPSRLVFFAAHLIVFTLFALTISQCSPARAQEIVHVFGNWRIEKIAENSSYILVGVGDVNDPQEKYFGFKYFRIQCYLGDPHISLMVPYDIQEPTHLNKAVKLLVWSDNNSPTEITMFRDKRILINISRSDDQEDNVVKFVNLLRNSSKRFSFGFEEKSISFDTQDFPPAWTTLTNLCTPPLPEK